MILYRKISVKDRLPTKNGLYIFFYASGYGDEVLDYGRFSDESNEIPKGGIAFIGEISSEHAWIKYPYEKDRKYFKVTAWLEETSFPE